MTTVILRESGDGGGAPVARTGQMMPLEGEEAFSALDAVGDGAEESTGGRGHGSH
jgi:hypothetical protein